MMIKSDADVICTVPGSPVSVNRMYGKRADGKEFLTKAANTYETDVSQIVGAASHRLRTDLRLGALKKPLAIRVTFYRVRGDADNYLKCLLDGVKYGLGVDDRYFCSVESIKKPGKEQKAIIEIWATRVPEIEQAIERGLQKAKELITNGR